MPCSAKRSSDNGRSRSAPPPPGADRDLDGTLRTVDCGASGQDPAVWAAIERACRDEDFRPQDLPPLRLLHASVTSARLTVAIPTSARRRSGHRRSGVPELHNGLFPRGQNRHPARPRRSRSTGRPETGAIGPAPCPSTGGRRPGWRELVRAYRGRPGLDGAAKVITGLGDHGCIWAATPPGAARRPGPGAVPGWLRALAVAGIESRLVNSALKQSVGRSRPDRTGIAVSAGVVPVREPTSSSFPSGHTLAGFCAATVMCRPGDRPATSSF